MAVVAVCFCFFSCIVVCQKILFCDRPLVCYTIPTPPPPSEKLFNLEKCIQDTVRALGSHFCFREERQCPHLPRNKISV